MQMTHSSNEKSKKLLHSEEKIFDHLLNKPYVNGISFGEQNLNLKHLVLDISKEVLWISVGQRAANLGSVNFKDAPIVQVSN